MKMTQKTEQTDAASKQPHLPAGVVLRPPVSLKDLTRDTERDPQGADEFVSLIRAIRREGAQNADH